eukprot:scaffold7496_cov38-Tisochrysis_lutea.AAC.3
MVCDDCKGKLSVLSTPDPWKAGSSGPERRLNENKLLRKGVRSNPYGNACKICKLKTQQNGATYCSICAYAKGICAICGKQVLDTSMYVMREGGTALHTVRDREDTSYKSAEQIAREKAQDELREYLESVGQVGRMPTRRALEAAGRKALADQLVETFGGLNAAADALSLSKRNLIEEAEERKERKQQALQRAQEARQTAHPATATSTSAISGVAFGSITDVDDQPPGIATSAVTTPGTSQQPHPIPLAHAVTHAAPRKGVAAPSSEPRSTDITWHYDPNTGYHYQLSSGVYYDSRTGMYTKDGKWTKQAPTA